MLDQETFFKEHYIDPEEFRACGFPGKSFVRSNDSYVSIEEHLRDLGKDFVDAYLYDIEKARAPTLIVTAPRTRSTFWKRSYASAVKILNVLQILTGTTTTNI